MNFFRLIILICLLYAGIIQIGHSQDNAWSGFTKDSIFSSLDSACQRFYYFKATGTEKQPLVVSLHQWSANYSNYRNSLAPETKNKNWNFIRPDFRGPNIHIKACCSRYVIADIDEAIDWAINNLPVDTDRIYVVGASGGGYTALCSFMKSRHRIKEFSVWVPISDLKRWYFESKSRDLRYASDVINCTCEDCDEINFEKAIERSPLYWDTPVEKLDYSKVKIYAGIHDGYTGSVPIIHSIEFFNKLVLSLGGGKADKVTDKEINWMLTTRTSPANSMGKIGDRYIHYSKEFKNVSITIFEGGHEILTNAILDKFSQD